MTTRSPLPTVTEFMVETFSGRFVDTKRPRADQIALEDIAHALSQTCRYGGHCKHFYSVAEHAVYVSRRLEQKGYSRDVQLAGLHHDDAEAYLGDIPRPMKSLLGKVYKILTARMDKAVFDALFTENGKLTIPSFTFARFEDWHDQIKDADNWLLLLEARDLLPSRGVNWTAAQQQAWGLERQGRIVRPPYWTGQEMMPRDAKAFYLARHAELTA